MILRGDPCGILCVFLIYVAIVYADYALTVWMVMPTFGESIWGALHLAIFNTLLFLVLVAHIRTMLTDPGIVPISKNSATRNRRQTVETSDESDSDREALVLRPSHKYVGEDWTVCTRCESFRPPRAHHCRICRRCIRKMDHHCPWVNNCVGEFNQKFFLQFLLYVGLSSMYALGVVILSWVYQDEHQTASFHGTNVENAHHSKVLHTVVLSIECALFGMFVFAVSCDQLQAIFHDETLVEAVQRRGMRDRRRRGRRSKVAMLTDVCGHGGILAWLLPCASIPLERDLVAFPQHSQLSHYDV